MQTLIKMSDKNVKYVEFEIPECYEDFQDLMANNQNLVRFLHTNKGFSKKFCFQIFPGINISKELLYLYDTFYFRRN